MGMPRVFSGRRGRWVALLTANGVVQAASGFLMAWLLRDALEISRGGLPPWRSAAGIMLLGGVMLALRAREASDAERLGQDYVMRVRLRIFDRVASRPARTTGRRRWGVTMTRLISDLNSLRNWVSLGIARSIVASVTIVGLLVALHHFSPLSASAALVVILACGLVVASLTPTLRKQIREARRRRGRLANNLGEKVLAAHTVRQLGRRRREHRRIRKHSLRLRDALVRRVRTRAILRALPDVARPAAIAGITIAAAVSAQPASESIVAVMLVGMIAAAVGDLARAWDYRLAFEEGRVRIAEILDGPRIVESRGAVSIPGTGPLDVTFRGVGIDGALRPIDLEVGAGERVLVTGPAGSGKSTLVALVARLLEPDRGEIRLGGLRLPSIRMDALHEAVQVVSPLMPLLRGTVEENIGYAVGGGDDDEWIGRVVEACGLERDPLLSPHGLDKRVEERAANLPEGLRARVALARAAAIRPRILLVDDPAFHFDSEAMRALESVIELTGATTFVVGPEGLRGSPWDRVVELERSGAPVRSSGDHESDRHTDPFPPGALARRGGLA
ncbi:MAG TPA: ABC transporter ATP-binding protein [Deltaproteobacteria bacterium]|nr:ABC transporter ATP-binding protein [Deltaproteobacteria bacterium]